MVFGNTGERTRGSLREEGGDCEGPGRRKTGEGARSDGNVLGHVYKTGKPPLSLKLQSGVLKLKVYQIFVKYSGSDRGNFPWVQSQIIGNYTYRGSSSEPFS